MRLASILIAALCLAACRGQTPDFPDSAVVVSRDDIAGSLSEITGEQCVKIKAGPTAIKLECGPRYFDCLPAWAVCCESDSPNDLPLETACF